MVMPTPPNPHPLGSFQYSSFVSTADAQKLNHTKPVAWHASLRAQASQLGIYAWVESSISLHWVTKLHLCIYMWVWLHTTPYVSSRKLLLLTSQSKCGSPAHRGSILHRCSKREEWVELRNELKLPLLCKSSLGIHWMTCCTPRSLTSSFCCLLHCAAWLTALLWPGQPRSTYQRNCLLAAWHQLKMKSACRENIVFVALVILYVIFCRNRVPTMWVDLSYQLSIFPHDFCRKVFVSQWLYQFYANIWEVLVITHA